MSSQSTTLSAKPSSLWTTGLALFSMFFGAGNLIFPLLIGQSVGAGGWFAIFGLGLTAVVVPFLGLAGMVLFEGDIHRFFGRIGRIPGWTLLLLLQLILGPFGVIPRLVTLMYAMAGPYLFQMPLFVFSGLMAALIFCFSFQRKRLIGILGSVLTPVLLLSLVGLIFFGLTEGSSFASETPSNWSAFLEGVLGGYNTMDLIAAFLFATVVLPHFKKEESSVAKESEVLKKVLYSSLIAASLLMLTYIGLSWVSSYHAWSLPSEVLPEALLGAIATKLLGPVGAGIAAVAVITACLTTAITLASIFADYLKKDLCKEKIGSTTALVITLVITTLFANLGFSGIAAFLGPILQICYPGLIVLTVLNILHSLYGFNRIKPFVYLTFAGSLLYYVLA